MADTLFKLNKDTRVVVSFPGDSAAKHVECASRINGFCAALGVYAKVEKVPRDDMTPEYAQTADLIVAIGGDGTTLDVARSVLQKPVLSLKLKDDSVGYLCADSVLNMGHVLQKLTSGVEIILRPRMQICINGTHVGFPVLNDVLLANECPARTTRYTIQHDLISEKHCSSGMWVATAVGSHAAAHASGAKPLFDDDERFLLRVREMNHADVPDPIIEMVFSPNNSPVVIPSGLHFRVFADGALWHYPVAPNDRITFAYAEPLRVVQLK